MFHVILDIVGGSGGQFGASRKRAGRRGGISAAAMHTRFCPRFPAHTCSLLLRCASAVVSAPTHAAVKVLDLGQLNNWRHPRSLIG